MKTLFVTGALVALFILTSGDGAAQVGGLGEALDRLTAAKRKYSELKSYELVVHMASYRGHMSSVPFDTATSVIYAQGKHFRSEALGVTSIQDDHYLLAIAREDSVLMVRDAQELQDPVPLADTSLFGKACERVERLDVDGRVRYTLFLSAGDYEALSFDIDGQGWIRRAECLYRDFLPESDDPLAPQYRPKVVLELEAPKTIDPRIFKEGFSTAPYVAWVKGKPEARDPRFTLIDGRVR